MLPRFPENDIRIGDPVYHNMDMPGIPLSHFYVPDPPEDLSSFPVFLMSIRAVPYFETEFANLLFSTLYKYLSRLSCLILLLISIPSEEFNVVFLNIISFNCLVMSAKYLSTK